MNRLLGSRRPGGRLCVGF